MRVAACCAIIIHLLLLLLWADRAQGTSISTSKLTATLGKSVTFPGVLRKDADSIEWTYSRAAGSQTTFVCDWFRNNAIECNPAYRSRVQLYFNASLTIRNLRYSDAGWYHVSVRFGWYDTYQRYTRLQVHASASQTVGSHLILILGLSFLKCLL